MKYIIFLSVIFLSAGVKAQTPTVIPATTTVEAFSSLTPGIYRFFGTGAIKDTTDLSNVTCPTCAACPPTPVCPPVPKPRNAISFTITKTGQVVVTYDSGPASTFTMRNNVIVQ